MSEPNENQRYDNGLTSQSLLNVIDRINDKITSCEFRVEAIERSTDQFGDNAVQIPASEMRGLKSALALIELEITRQRRAPNLNRMY